MVRCFLIQCVFWSLLIVLQLGGHECCVKTERMALLQIKAFFNSNVSHYIGDNSLSGWVDKGDDTDCCRWERVTCNSTTGRVTDLTLNDLVDASPCLNVSLFSPLKDLVNLQLSGNFFRSCPHNQGKLLLCSYSPQSFRCVHIISYFVFNRF